MCAMMRREKKASLSVVARAAQPCPTCCHYVGRVAKSPPAVPPPSLASPPQPCPLPGSPVTTPPCFAFNSPLTSPRCYDPILEEDMIFQMTDITEEDEEHYNSDTNNNSKLTVNSAAAVDSGGGTDLSESNGNQTSPKRSRGSWRSKARQSGKSKPIGIIPTIVTEDVDLEDGKDTVSTSNESSESWKECSEKNSSSLECDLSSGGSASSSGPRQVINGSSSAPRSSSHRVINHLQLNLRCSPPSDSMADTHPCHYHTVHGTGVVGQSHYYHVPETAPVQAHRSSSPVYGIPSKQRSRSHSGPTYPAGFTQQVRHSALISAGMSTRGLNGTTRRQSDSAEVEAVSSSLRNRVSPSGSTFFDSFRPRSTSDSKNKKPSVITTIKNNLLNRHNSSSSSSGNSSGSSQNGGQSPISNGSAKSSATSVQQASSHGHKHCQHHSHQCHHALVVDQQANGSPSQHKYTGTVSAPISPSSGSVIDPFSLDLHRVVAAAAACDCASNQVQIQPQRPRSRSGSSGPGSTMARVFDMFRGRSNSIATTSIDQQNCCAVRAAMSFSNQDSICDRFEFEDIDENLVYVRFFKFYRCYDIIPISAKLVVFDTQLAVKKAFFALLSNGVRAAPLWDSSKHQFIGMLTITDFIYILRTYYCSPQLKMEELEEHTLDIWRNMLKEKARSLVWIEPDESLFNAIRMLIHNKVHRLPVIDRDTGNVLYVLTHKRLLKFLFLYYYTRLPMPSYLSKTLRELPQIGTYENIAMATQNTPLIDAITMMVERRISALPIVDKKNKVIDVYAKFDVIHLAADQMYQNLDITVKKALEYRAQSERVIKCTLNETLHQILERIVQAEVHRIIVVDNDDHVIGMISLSDLLSFLVLRPVSNLKCSKVLLEETEAESECESQGSGRHPTPTPPGTASSATSERHPSAASSSSLLEEQNQLTASSSGSSDDSSGNSSLINTSSKLLLAAANGGPSTSTQAATLIA